MTASVRVVIVRWRGGDEIRLCLDSLLANAGSRLAHVVLVDSGSADGEAVRLAADYPEIEVIALAENRGFAFAAGCGAAEGSEPLLLLLNPDTEVWPGTLDLLIEQLVNRPGAAGCVPLLEGFDGESQHRWQLRHLPKMRQLAIGKSGNQLCSAPPLNPITVPQPAAAAWLVRRIVWEALGGLDPTFEPAWWEDVDFCARLDRRLHDPGFPADDGFFVVPGAKILHGGGSSVSALGPEAFFSAYFTNLLRYTARHHPGRLGLIRRGLQASLTARMYLRPGQRQACRAALAAIAARPRRNPDYDSGQWTMRR